MLLKLWSLAVVVTLMVQTSLLAQRLTDATNELGLAGSDDAVLGHTPPALAQPQTWPDEKAFTDPGYQRLSRFIPRLRHDRQERWPILLWAKATQAGPELDAWVDRGLSPLFNLNLQKYVPAYKQMQQRQVPVILLWQGHVQKVYRHNKGEAADPTGLTSLMAMNQPKAIEKEGDQATALYRLLKEQDVDVEAMFLDFETGLYLRNGNDTSEKVEAIRHRALADPACVAALGEKNIGNTQVFRSFCDRSRAQVVRIGAVEPLHRVYPDAWIGNFFSWPIDRLMNDGVLDPADYATPGGCEPAYGYSGSGMNILQPRSYYVHGWQSWGLPETVTDPRIADWNVFLYTIKTVSQAARVMRPNEKLVPWVGWLWYHSFRNNPDRQLAAASAQAYRETLIHVFLRGAETVAIFDPASLTADFAADYPIDRPEMGPFLRNVVDVQAAYDEVLCFQGFLKTATPLNLQQDGAVNVPGTAWSGYGNATVSLVRTVSFTGPQTHSLWLYGRYVALPFREQGTWFWVFPDGFIQEDKKQ